MELGGVAVELGGCVVVVVVDVGLGGVDDEVEDEVVLEDELLEVVELGVDDGVVVLLVVGGCVVVVVTGGT